MAFLASGVGRYASDRFSLTARALALTLLLALPVPLALCGSGALLATQALDPFSQELGAGLLAAGAVCLLLDFFRLMCRGKGLADAHFGWNPRARRTLLNNLRWLLAVEVPAALVTATCDAAGAEVFRQGLGRLAFLVGSIGLTIFVARVFRPGSGVFAEMMARDGWAWRLRKIWYGLLVATPAALTLLAAAGVLLHRDAGAGPVLHHRRDRAGRRRALQPDDPLAAGHAAAGGDAAGAAAAGRAARGAAAGARAGRQRRARRRRRRGAGAGRADGRRRRRERPGALAAAYGGGGRHPLRALGRVARLAARAAGRDADRAGAGRGRRADADALVAADGPGGGRADGGGGAEPAGGAGADGAGALPPRPRRALRRRDADPLRRRRRRRGDRVARAGRRLVQGAVDHRRTGRRPGLRPPGDRRQLRQRPDHPLRATRCASATP